jgi:hypothetical protein
MTSSDGTGIFCTRRKEREFTRMGSADLTLEVCGIWLQKNRGPEEHRSALPGIRPLQGRRSFVNTNRVRGFHPRLLTLFLARKPTSRCIQGPAPAGELVIE